jgi:hypothetical protein
MCISIVLPFRIRLKIFTANFVLFLTLYIEKNFPMDSFIKSIKKLISSCDCNYKCNAKRFKQNFKNWTSGDNYIDKFIQSTQLLDHSYFGCQALEWIPYDRFYDIRNIADGEFGKVYRTNWIDGNMECWYDRSHNWKRDKPNMFVILKILNNPASITLEIINKVY